MNATPICLHCGRPIRVDSRAYAANGGFFHWECTEPPVGTIKKADMRPGDTLVLETDRPISNEQCQVLREQLEQRFSVKALVLFGTKLQAILRSPRDPGRPVVPAPPPQG